MPVTSPANAQTPLSFSKSFSPATIGPGSVSTLQFDITNNTSNPVQNLDFTDNLPAGVTNASPANASTNCLGGTLSAPDGGGTISYSGGAVPALTTCSVVVDVTSSTAATHNNVSGDLTSDAGNSGSASADLTVDAGRPGFSKSFSPATVFFGGRSTLTLTVDNTANSNSALNLTFSDNLPPGMAIASPSNVSTDCNGGSLTAAAGVINYSPFFLGDASVAAAASCSISVDVIGNAIGQLDNVSGELTSEPGPSGGATRSSGKASASLSVTVDKIALTKAFTDDPVAPGGTVTLEFTIRNLDRAEAATAISFTDNLDAVITGLAATGLPANDVCGSGSQLSGTGLVTLTGGNVDPEGSCTFSVSVAVPSTAGSGSFTNTTSSITATVGQDSATGDPASDLLFVVPAPFLTKTFTGDPVGAGDSVGLDFTITNTSPTSGATNIAFSDTFVEELPTASVIPADGFCGAGSSATYTPLIEVQAGSAILARLDVTGANLAAGASCNFSVTLGVSSGAAAGTYLNTTSAITATVDAATVTGTPASDTFGVLSAPTLFKEFTDDPVAAGGTATLEFTISYDENSNLDFDDPEAATAITFTDNLDAVITGLVATGLPASNVCGSGSSLTGTSTLTLTGGNIAVNEACTFSVSVSVPAGATAGSFTNTTSNIQATVLGKTTVGNQATDDLNIAGLTLTKEFIDDPVVAGGTVTLRFTIDNISPTQDATAIAFVDDLDDVLDNLVGTGLPVSGCGGTLSGQAGNTVLQFSGGSLTAGTSCTFDVVLDVPAGTASDTYNNTTSSFSATQGGGTVAFENASDELVVASDLLSLTKEFTDDPVEPGGTVNLRFTLTNLDGANAASAIAFTDDLDAALTGLVATGLPAAACGGTASGTDTISFSGGSLAAGASCNFDVSLSVPAGVALGTSALNTTSGVTGTINGLTVNGDPASDNLQIAFVEFSKAFGGFGEIGGTATLTFTIENVSATESLTNLEFSDDLDAVVSGLVATGLPANDVCGVGSVVDGTDFISMTGGSLLPGGSCSFVVDLLVPGSAVEDDYLNVTSDLRQDGIVAAPPATATLTLVDAGDDDNDGVINSFDVCADTVIPESVPTVSLGFNRYALMDSDFTFEYGGGQGPTLTTTDTGGCSCEQIATELELGPPHFRFGCTRSVMESWVASLGSSLTAPSTADGRGSGEPKPTPTAPRTGFGVSVSVTGSGSVASSRAEIDGKSYFGLVCSGGSSCHANFANGADVALYARPEGAGSVFLGWGGDCQGSSQVTVVRAGRNTSCTATFSQVDP